MTLTVALAFLLMGALQSPAAILRVLTEPAGKRLAVFKDGRDLGSIAVPVTLSDPAIEDGLRKVLVHPNGDDLAVGFKSDKGSFVVVFLRQPDGSYLAVDVSAVEKVNIGGIGPNRTYRTVETMPTGWLDRSENATAVQLWLQTRAWDLSGRRYAIREALIITRDGNALWR
jgi:hypothetical protein